MLALWDTFATNILSTDIHGKMHKVMNIKEARINVCIRLDGWTHKYIKPIFEAMHCRTNNALYASK